jgi:hypothetical protein
MLKKLLAALFLRTKTVEWTVVARERRIPNSRLYAADGQEDLNAVCDVAYRERKRARLSLALTRR